MLTVFLLSGGDAWQVKCLCWAQSKHQLSGRPRLLVIHNYKDAGCDTDADLCGFLIFVGGCDDEFLLWPVLLLKLEML